MSTSIASIGTSGSVESHRTEQLRRKRHQVTRACDGCRAQRVKCDNNQPCSNCRSRGRQCIHSNEATKTSALAKAHEEIGNLRRQVRELEGKLEQERNNAAANLNYDLLNFSLSPAQGPHTRITYSDQNGNLKRKFWEGIQIRPASFSHDTWFGPSSLYCFIKRLSLSLSASLQQPHSESHMLLSSESSRNLIDGPTPPCEVKGLPSIDDHNNSTAGYDLSSTQEEYFISLFWESYHTSLFAILDEAEFKKHHQSLWMTSAKKRKPSALVDIILAMCMQYAISKLPVDKQGSIAGSNDATIAGRWHYRRCQALLTYELENPTVSTLQCHLLCAIYLCGGSYHNMVDSSCGLAVRTAYMLGLHVDPPPTMPPREREKRRRLWWAVYLMDSKSNMKLGRPFLLDDSYAMPRLPSDDLEASMLSGSTFATIGDNVTWLSFNLYHTTLYKAVRRAHTAFYDRDLNLPEGQTIWDDYRALETCAELLRPHTKHVQDWVDSVPDALKTKRQNDGRPLSTDGSALEIEQFAPLWLQRQRLLIEMSYHHLCINLYRLFIPQGLAPVTGLRAEEMAMTCASHAIALTNMAHQVLSSTSILDGWFEVFQWQWNAAMTLVGFVFAHRHSSSTPAARSAIDVSVSIFDLFGARFAVAAGAANIVRDLRIKIDFLAGQSRPARRGVPDTQEASSGSITHFVNSDEQAFIDNGFAMANTLGMDASAPDFSNQTLFDMALSVPFWGDFDSLWPDMEFVPELWPATS